jgi:hypothetical protein
MAHFAQLDENNVVTQVIVVANQELLDNGIELEQKGIEFCSNLLGGNWKQTSYNENIRKNYAGIGYTYNEILDAFISPKTHNSWLLNETTCKWEAPIPVPNDGKAYIWNEDILNWVEIFKE